MLAGMKKAGPGRPPKPPEEQAQKVNVRLYARQFERLSAMQKSGEDLSATLRRVIDEAYERLKF